MRLLKSVYPIFLVIAIFIVFGCKIGDLQGTKKNDETPATEKDSGGETLDPEIAEANEDSGDVVPDIEFPEEKNTGSSPETNGGSKTTVVQFRKGANSASYKNTVVRGEKHTYIFEAAKGQNLRLNLSAIEDNAVFYVKTPTGGFLGNVTDREPADNLSETLPTTGKYRIVVSPTRGNATFTLSLSITGNSSAENSSTVESVGGLTTVVQFRKGATSAAYKNAVARGQRNKYILGATAGQRMEVTIDSLENDAVFDIQIPNGSYLAREQTSWNGRLPANGKYHISVGATRGNATYTVRFAVK